MAEKKGTTPDEYIHLGFKVNIYIHFIIYIVKCSVGNIPYGRKFWREDILADC